MAKLMKHTIRYCPFCGSGNLALTEIEGDGQRRHHCRDCGHIQYFNPIAVVGAVLAWQGKILLCQRSIEPRRGLWTYPAGFMELRESVQDGAARECREEALAECESLRLFAVFSLHREGQVHLTYQGRLRNGQASAGDETLQTKLVAPEDIDYSQLAFPVVAETLRLYTKDVAAGSFGLHQGSIILNRDGSWRTRMEQEPPSQQE